MGPAGHYDGGSAPDEQIVHVVLTEQGQSTLSPGEFAEEHRWQNDPKRAGLGDR